MPTARVLFSVLILATGTVGLIAGVRLLALCPSARVLSLVFGGLLIFSSVFSFFTVPIIASIGSYDISSISTEGLVRLIIFGGIDVVLPVFFSFILFAAFYKPGWKATLAKDRTA
jgi:hypothetical protein